MRLAPTFALVSGLLAFLPGVAGAQSRLIESRAFGVAPGYTQWSFSSPILTDNLSVSGAAQLAVPLEIGFTPFRNWRFDVSGAITNGSATIETIEGASTISLNGLTDVKLRLAGAVSGERVFLTVGANLPTGRVGLSEEEAAAIRIIGAPALRMQAPVLGSGLGLIAGAVYTASLGEWAVGLGASYELRGTYSPLDATLASGSAGTDIDLRPAGAMHISVGLDRIIGQGRLSMLVVGDRYGTDRITVRESAGPGTETDYRLGPTIAAMVDYRTATQRIRDFRVSAALRHRSPFTDEAGDRADGSSGSSFDAAIAATIGGARRPGLVLGLDGAFDSGLDIDDTLATASMRAAGLTIGLDFFAGRFAIQPYIRGTLGRVDAGAGPTSARAIGGGIRLNTAW